MVITMKTLNSLSIFSFLIFISLFSASTYAATFSILNNCPYTVWAAALPGGGWRMDRGQTWALNVNRGTSLGRIWGRTNCSFDNHDHGTCLTGDCANRFRCTTNGTAPKTTAEFSLDQSNRDTYRISLVDGYNVPMEFRPESGSCRSVRCNANILGECPNDLKRPGGCINPCTLRDCGPTQLTRFFKQRCPNTYTFPGDNVSTFTCRAGTNYRVIFCP